MTETTYASIEELLSGCTVESLVDSRHKFQRQVITIASDVSLADALKTLRRYNILSAPIVDAASKGSGEKPSEGPATERLTSSFGSIMGMVSVKSIVHAILDTIDAKLHDKTHSEKRVSMLTWLAELEKMTPSLHNTSVQVAIESDNGMLFEARHGMLLKELISSGFLKEDHGKYTHRVGVADESGRVSSIVSQTDVVRFISKHGDALGDLGATPIVSLDVINKSLVTVSAGSMVIEVLLRMQRESLSAVAVEDGRAGVLIGSFSLSDLRGLAVDHMGVLGLPIAEYLALLHDTEYAGYTVSGSKHASHPYFENKEKDGKRLSESLAIQHLVTCTPETPLKDVLSSLSESGLHQIYVVDGEFRPVGVIPLKNLVELLART